jgi:hypothetical protein
MNMSSIYSPNTVFEIGPELRIVEDFVGYRMGGRRLANGLIV